MNRTKIEYLDRTLNLVIGCSGIGCAVREHCWAKVQAKRQKHRCSTCYSFEPHYHRERLNEALKLKKPSRIGLNFMGETFDKLFRDYCPYIWKEMFSMMEKAHWHTFVILTKQPQNIPNVELPKNLWLGVSVNNFTDKWRIGTLKATRALTKVVSFEPLYESMTEKAIDPSAPFLYGIDWVIIGAQTRPEAQPEQRWIWDIIFEATAQKIPIFLKDNLHHTNPIQHFPEVKT